MLKIISKINKFKSVCECYECGSHYTTNHYDAKKSPLGHLCSDCKKPPETLTQAVLHKYYCYDPITGKLTHRTPQHGKQAGDKIGSITTNGYLKASVANSEYLVHRLIWLYQTGYMPEQVDHIDHNRMNNKWDNLREVANVTNSMNTSLSSNSTTKINGVSFMKTRNKYRATITIAGKQKHLGLFDTVEQATEARRLADIEYGFHTNHGNT